MKTEPAESLLKRITAQYNEKPRGWRVFADPKGNVLILGPQVGYRLKLVPLSPGEFVGVGADVDPLEEMRKEEPVPFYGLRPLSRQQASELFGSIQPSGQISSYAIRRLLGVEPVPTWDLQEKKLSGLLTGPIVTHPNLSAVPRGQEELEAKLSLEADRLFRARYPFRAGIYG
jgi:hypothetical protein